MGKVTLEDILNPKKRLDLKEDLRKHTLERMVNDNYPLEEIFKYLVFCEDRGILPGYQAYLDRRFNKNAGTYSYNTVVFYPVVLLKAMEYKDADGKRVLLDIGHEITEENGKLWITAYLELTSFATPCKYKNTVAELSTNSYLGNKMPIHMAIKNAFVAAIRIYMPYIIQGAYTPEEFGIESSEVPKSDTFDTLPIAPKADNPVLPQENLETTNVLNIKTHAEIEFEKEKEKAKKQTKSAKAELASIAKTSDTTDGKNFESVPLENVPLENVPLESVLPEKQEENIKEGDGVIVQSSALKSKITKMKNYYKNLNIDADKLCEALKLPPTYQATETDWVSSYNPILKGFEESVNKGKAQWPKEVYIVPVVQENKQSVPQQSIEEGTKDKEPEFNF